MNVAAKTGNTKFINTYLTSYKDICNIEELFSIKFNLSKTLHEKDNNYKVDKEELFELLEKCSMNEYFKLHFSKQIELL